MGQDLEDMKGPSLGAHLACTQARSVSEELPTRIEITNSRPIIVESSLTLRASVASPKRERGAGYFVSRCPGLLANAWVGVGAKSGFGRFHPVHEPRANRRFRDHAFTNFYLFFFLTPLQTPRSVLMLVVGSSFLP